jgi:hypothetical protein
MAYSRDQAFDTHKDYKENVNQWEFFIRSFNGGYDYTIGQYLNRYNLELDNEYNQRLGNTPCDNHCKNNTNENKSRRARTRYKTLFIISDSRKCFRLEF